MILLICDAIRHCKTHCYIIDVKDFSVDFIGIGVPRSATTWLYRCLDEHPGVCMSRPKELNFFGEKNPYTPSNGSLGWEWYQSRFSHWKRGQIRGEISPHYFCSGAAKHIAKAFPNAKIILLLRNPAEALFDLYQLHSRLRKVAPSFEEFIKEEPEAVAIYSYAKYINEWLSYFKREQLFVRLLEDIEKNSDEVFNDILAFLSLAPFSPSVLHQKINSHEGKLSRFLGKRLLGIVTYLLEKTPLRRLYPIFTRIRDILEKGTVKSIDKVQQIDPATRKKLIDYYADSNQKIAATLHINVEHWNAQSLETKTEP